VSQPSPAILAASVVLGIAVAIIWMGAPVVPAVVGAITAGAVVYWRTRKR